MSKITHKKRMDIAMRRNDMQQYYDIIYQLGQHYHRKMNKPAINRKTRKADKISRKNFDTEFRLGKRDLPF